MKKFFIMATLIVTFTSAMAFANDKVISTMYVVECNQSITLRDAPSIYANELAQIPLGQAVGFIENAGNGFYKINYDGLIGYALSKYLSADRSGVAGIYGVVVNCKFSITLRDAPSIYANELAQIPLGERVGVYPYYETDEFYCVKYRGVRGYVLKTYLRVE